MSSCPGYTLEAFLCWQYNIIVEGRDDANFSLGLAEHIGNIPPRLILTETQFQSIINLFEQYREQVEDRLSDFDEDELSWRSYAGYAFDFIPEDIYQCAESIIAEMKIKPL